MNKMSMALRKALTSHYDIVLPYRNGVTVQNNNDNRVVHITKHRYGYTLERYSTRTNKYTVWYSTHIDRCTYYLSKSQVLQALQIK